MQRHIDQKWSFAVTLLGFFLWERFHVEEKDSTPLVTTLTSLCLYMTSVW